LEKRENFWQGIPGLLVTFFKNYQKHLEVKRAGKWYYEETGRFAINFRHSVREMQHMGVWGLDMIALTAIILSHEDAYFEILFDPRYATSNWHAHELDKTAKMIKKVTAYMAMKGSVLRQDNFADTDTMELNRDRYTEFIRQMPKTWGWSERQPLFIRSKLGFGVG